MAPAPQATHDQKDDSNTPPGEKPKASLTDRTSQAAVWTVVQTAMAKGPAFLSHIILGKLLLAEDFGLYALASTVYTFASIMHQAGIQQVVIKRQKAFRVWGNPGFWLSCIAGLIAMIGTMIAAPWVAYYYRYSEPEVLTRLIQVMALTFPIASLGAISRARMQIDLKFKQLALIGSIVSVLDVAFKVCFAAMGFGAFSFAYGTVIVSVFNLAMCWYVSPPPVKLHPQFRRMRYLLSDSSMVILTTLFVWMIEEGDYVVLGSLEDVTSVGVYFMAFKITRHTMLALTFNFSRVLFPALSSLPADEEKRVRAFVRAARMVVALALPCCVALSATAEPFIRIFFEPRWYGAIPLIQIMGIGMAMRTINWPAASLLQAQGRFSTRLYLWIIAIFLFFPMTIAGTRLGSVIGLSVSVAIFHVLFALVELALALGPGKQVGRDVLRIFCTPIVGMIIATMPALAAAYVALPLTGLTGLAFQITQLLILLVMISAGYILAVRLIDPPLLEDFLGRLRGMRRR